MLGDLRLAGPAHLEGFGSVEGVAHAKGEILDTSVRPLAAVLNADDRYLPYWESRAADLRVITFGSSESATVRALDVRSDERFARADSIAGAGVRSLVAAPLLDAEGVLGMIVLGSRAYVRRFSEEDLELLVSLAAVAASESATVVSSNIAPSSTYRRLIQLFSLILLIRPAIGFMFEV